MDNSKNIKEVKTYLDDKPFPNCSDEQIEKAFESLTNAVFRRALSDLAEISLPSTSQNQLEREMYKASAERFLLSEDGMAFSHQTSKSLVRKYKEDPEEMKKLIGVYNKIHEHAWQEGQRENQFKDVQRPGRPRKNHVSDIERGDAYGQV